MSGGEGGTIILTVSDTVGIGAAVNEAERGLNEETAVHSQLALITFLDSGAHPEHPIAPGGGRPVDPGYGVSGPVDPGYGVPAPPPGIWPSPGYPAHPIAPGGRPPGIWGGAGEGFPTPPIYLPPVLPGGPPVQIWPKPGPLPHPEHPIVLPPPPTEGLDPDGGKPPPPDGGWGYDPAYGWGYFPGPTEPGPK